MGDDSSESVSVPMFAGVDNRYLVLLYAKHDLPPARTLKQMLVRVYRLLVSPAFDFKICGGALRDLVIRDENINDIDTHCGLNDLNESITKVVNALKDLNIHRTSASGAGAGGWRKEVIFSWTDAAGCQHPISIDFVNHAQPRVAPGVDVSAGNIAMTKNGITRVANDDRLPSLAETISHIKNKEFVPLYDPHTSRGQTRNKKYVVEKGYTCKAQLPDSDNTARPAAIAAGKYKPEKYVDYKAMIPTINDIKDAGPLTTSSKDAPIFIAADKAYVQRCWDSLDPTLAEMSLLRRQCEVLIAGKCALVQNIKAQSGARLFINGPRLTIHGSADQINLAYAAVVAAFPNDQTVTPVKPCSNEGCKRASRDNVEGHHCCKDCGDSSGAIHSRSCNWWYGQCNKALAHGMKVDEGNLSKKF